MTSSSRSAALVIVGASGRARVRFVCACEAPWEEREGSSVMEYATERVGAIAMSTSLCPWSLRSAVISLPTHAFVRFACQLSVLCSARGLHRGSF